MTTPRPVLTTAGITGLITSIAGVLAFLGYNDASAHLSAATAALAATAIGVVNLAAHLGSALHSQTKVSPIAQPGDVNATQPLPSVAIPTADDAFAAVGSSSMPQPGAEPAAIASPAAEVVANGQTVPPSLSGGVIASPTPGATA